MKIKRNLSQSEVSLEIDLKKAFGKSVNDPAIQRSIAESFIQKILDRTAKGIGVDGNGQEVKLKSPYSKEYTESLEFKAFDKSKNKVNMQLTGSMLSSIDLISVNNGIMTIGIENEDAPKAHGHMTGADGSRKLPVRPFLGITDKDIEEIKKEFAPVLTERLTAADIFDNARFARIAQLFSSKGRIGFGN